MAIGWALVGPGRHAERNVVAQMKQATDTRLVAVVSRDRVRAEAFAGKHGFARAYASLEQALRDPDVQALYHATPDGVHARDVVAAALAGRHSLVEKPLAISLGEARRAIEACRIAGVKLGVVFNQRHEAAHQEARRMVLAGEIGEVVLARVQIVLATAPASQPPGGGNWRADPAMRRGGILISIGDHALDTLERLVGQDIEEVAAVTDAAGGGKPNERSAGMLLKLSRGAIGHAVSSSNAPFGRRPFEIHGTRGSIIVENTYSYLTGAGKVSRPSVERIDERGSSLAHFAPGECFRLEIEQFNRAIEGRCEPMTPAAEGLRMLALTEALYESARSGRVARVADFMAS